MIAKLSGISRLEVKNAKTLKYLRDNGSGDLYTKTNAIYRDWKPCCDYFSGLELFFVQIDSKPHIRHHEVGANLIDVSIGRQFDSP